MACHTHTQDFTKCGTKGTLSQKELNIAWDHRACNGEMPSWWLAPVALHCACSAREWLSFQENLGLGRIWGRWVPLGVFLRQIQEVTNIFYQVTAARLPMGDGIFRWGMRCPHRYHISLLVAAQQAEDVSRFLSIYLQGEASLQLSQGCWQESRWKLALL